jgi:Ca-activated chloride channel family protein
MFLAMGGAACGGSGSVDDQTSSADGESESVDGERSAPDGNSGSVDDATYFPGTSDEMGGPVGSTPSSGSSSGNGSDMGFAVGGAMDVNSFRENVTNGYLPLAEDITFEGLFYDYSFDTGAVNPCSARFCPSYSPMRSTDPLTGDSVDYLSVGLNSNLSEAEFERKRLNLVVVLDISGSMGSRFDEYYYDEPSTGPVSNKPKMTIANESVVAMLDHLREGDRFGMVLFESEAHLAKPVSPFEHTAVDALKENILELRPDGGTNMEAGFAMGMALLSEYRDADPSVFENRVVFLTDAMPNTGATSAGSLLGMVQQGGEQNIFSTFVGIGVDFNTELTEQITKARGANYFSVHNETEFKVRLDDEFELMVTPLVFDLKLVLDSDGFSIDRVFGSPEADESTGELMYVRTLFPARVDDGETRGGVVLLKLAATNGESTIDMAATWQDRAGVVSSSETSFVFEPELDVAPNSGIRKAILLSRYASLVHEWIAHEREALGLGELSPSDPGYWERESKPLVVSEPYRQKFGKFLEHFVSEAGRIGDDHLDEEINILEKLANWKPEG